MPSPETVHQLWENVALPTIQHLLSRPFQSKIPPLSLATSYIGEGLSLARAVAKSVIVEAQALEVVCREGAPLFPPEIIAGRFAYAPAYIDLAERLIGGTSVDEIVAEHVRNATVAGKPHDDDKVQALRVALTRLVPVQTSNRSGFRLIDTFASPMALSVFNKDPYPDIIGFLVVSGGQRYKSVYQAMKLG